MAEVWRKCSVCKKDIPVNAIYQACSVSSCRKNVFCSVTCWDVHRSVENHLRAWAEEERAPATPAASEEAPRRRIVTSAPASSTSSQGGKEEIPHEVLVVVSKLKNYIKAKSGGMNTSDTVVDVLSQRLRDLCDDAIYKARQDGRKTVMDRDF